MNIKDQYMELALAGEVPLIFDGAFGTMAMKLGLLEKGVIGDMLNLTHPKAVTEIFKAYVDAGAQVISTATFNSIAPNLAKQDGSPSVRDMYAAAVECARAAKPEYIVGDIGASGMLMEPYGDITADELYDLFAEQVDAACRAGVDFILVETMQNLEEAELAVRAAADFGNVPVIATMSFESSGKTMYGNTPAEAVNVLTTVGASIVGANCGIGPADMIGVAREFVANSFVPILVQPNAGLPRLENGVSVYDVNIDEFKRCMKLMVESGVTCVGSCCGTTPEFTAAIASLF